MLSSNCLQVGTNLSCSGLRWTSVIEFGWERMEWVLRGESFHVGRMRTDRNGLAVVVEHARACMIALRKSSGSNSGASKHESVHR